MMRDIRTKNWFWIENSLIDREDLEPYEKLIYMTLARYADGNGRCFPGLELLMKSTGIGSKKTLIKYIKKLELKGLIEIIKRQGKGNIYFLKNVESEPVADLPLVSEITSVKIATTPVADLPPHQCQNCPPNNTQEQYPIKNTQIKEKNKKGNITENLLDYIETLEIDSEKKKIFKEWVEYKKEKNQYKNTKSIDVLIKRFIKYSVQELRDIVEKSIMNNYSGIFEPKEINKTDQENNNEISKMTPEEREKMIKAKYFGGA
jgi:hypothetical protein